MPIIKSAIKRARQTVKRRERNITIKKDIKSAYKSFVEKPSAATLSSAQSELDMAVKKNLLKKNTASRRKAKLYKIAKDNNISLSKKPTKKVAPAPKASVAKKVAPKKAASKKTAAKKASK